MSTREQIEGTYTTQPSNAPETDLRRYIYGDEQSCMKECYCTKTVTMVPIRGQLEQGDSSSD